MSAHRYDRDPDAWKGEVLFVLLLSILLLAVRGCRVMQGFA